ncbi:uncharacterized protein LOC128870434 [Anastrepha ludens]|uniref:uncharacterized protein LOC128870434 n=1 Tax=Anastrepha ludens TaxID=28586 RepID=UPI0023B01394|nr:uncharacterized protein LOC128870434 [Anastrepha ludens]
MFNNIRNRYFGNMTFPIRVDDFIVKHTDIIDGKMHMSGIDTTPTMSSQQSPTDVNSPRSFCKEPLHRDSSVTCKICTSSFAATIPEDEPLDKHLCQLCLRMSKEEIENILASRTYENWYGLVAKEEKKKIAVEKKRKVETQSLYLQPNFTENQLLLHQSLKRFPVLKNGNSCTAPVPVDGKATVLSNTCAFDSIAQIFTVACFDDADFMECCKKSKLIFFDLIASMSTHQLNYGMYITRAKLLKSLMPFQEGEEIDAVKCQINAGELCAKLFSKIPSFTTIKTCSTGCAPIEKDWPTVLVPLNEIKQIPQYLEESVFIRHAKPCRNCKITTNIDFRIGPFAIVEIYPVDDNNCNIQLKDFQKCIEFKNKNKLQLLGVVKFREFISRKNTRNQEMKKLKTAIENKENILSKNEVPVNGHYTGLVLCGDNSWIEFDDFNPQQKPKKIKDCTWLQPHVAIYKLKK